MTKHIIMPTERLYKVKFVQIYLMDGRERVPIFRYDSFSDGGNSHVCLLDSVFREFGIHPRELILPKWIPKPKTDTYEVCGAGKLDFNNGLFTVYGRNSDYNLFPNEEHLKEIQKRESKFEFEFRNYG